MESFSSKSFQISLRLYLILLLQKFFTQNYNDETIFGQLLFCQQLYQRLLWWLVGLFSCDMCWTDELLFVSVGQTPVTPATFHLYVLQQELSYRKQIARKLRIQYVEGTHRPKYYTVTLKSRLRVNQNHWKRNHWTHHTRLTISRVIWRWILSWPWNVG